MLDKYELCLSQGGIFQEAILSYPLAILSHGWKLNDEREGTEAAKVQEHLDSYGIDIDAMVNHLVVEAAVYQTAVEEKVLVGGRVQSIAMPDSRTFFPQTDQRGRLVRYEQRMPGVLSQSQTFEIDSLVIWHWNKFGSSLYGTGLVAPAFDDIKRDTMVSEACAKAIERHGFRKYHIRVGKEGEVVSQDVVTAVGKEFEKLETQNELATIRDVEIRGLDEGALGGVLDYNSFSVSRLCAALGVPEEVLGLGRGSTESTATVKRQAFYDKIRALQRSLAATLSTQLIDSITGKKGIVWLEFNDPNPESDNARVDRVTKLVSAVPLEPDYIITQDEAREMIGMGAKKGGKK